MIEDFHRFADRSTFSADVCIIGAGAAGITIAKEFVATRHTVLLLEAGGFTPDPQDQQLYQSEVAGLPHVGVHEGRARVFGGTTTLWGGQALRFSASDLRKRDWIPYSGWPLTLEDLNPYYERAEKVLQLGAPVPYDELCSRFGVQPPAFDPAKLYVECSRWSPRPNFGAAYREELASAANITVLLHANVTSITTNEAATAIERIEFTTLEGKTGTATARFYLICCGGIETARLLLASTRVESCGVGNRRDLVGRFFQEHIHIRFGELIPARRSYLQDLYESFFIRGLKYAPKITLTDEVCRNKKLLTIHAEVSFEQAPGSGIAALKTLFRAARGGASITELAPLLGKAMADPGEWLGLGYRFYVKKRSGSPQRGPVFLGAQSEMAPNPDSRVMLGDSTDRLGMPRTKIDWRAGELERVTSAECLDTIVSEFERLGLAKFDRKQCAALADSAEWLAMVHDSAHHMGTTRMHETAEMGVVDPNCRVHGIPNLYIASSSVFPTSARSNPTLTILALGIRIADRLKELL